jgi:hypothetical protein
MKTNGLLPPSDSSRFVCLHKGVPVFAEEAKRAPRKCGQSGQQIHTGVENLASTEPFPPFPLVLPDC